MSNVTPINGIDVAAIKAEATKEINAERSKKAVEAIKRKLRALADAEQIVANIKREIADLEASINDGSFVA